MCKRTLRKYNIASFDSFCFAGGIMQLGEMVIDQMLKIVSTQRLSVMQSMWTRRRNLLGWVAHPPTPRRKWKVNISWRIFLKFGRHNSFLWGNRYPCFRLPPGNICHGFHSQDRSLTCMLHCLFAMDSSNLPLVWHLLTSWKPALQLFGPHTFSKHWWNLNPCQSVQHGVP